MGKNMKKNILASVLSLSMSACMLSSVAYANDTQNQDIQNNTSVEKVQAKQAPSVTAEAVTSLPSVYNAYKDWDWAMKNKGNTELSANYAANELVEAYLWVHDNKGVNFSNQYMNYLTASDATADGKNMYAEENTTLTDNSASLFKRTLGQSQSVSRLLELNVQGHGPVLESAFSDSTTGKLANESALKISPEYYVLSTDKLEGSEETTPNVAVMTQRMTDIKNAIVNFGGVSLDYALDNNYISAENSAMYRPIDSATTQTAVQSGVIVGWDDAYLPTNFKQGTQPLAPGAFIVRAYNGQKTTTGDEYFYVSYLDHSVARNDNYYVSAVVNKDEVKDTTENILNNIPDTNLKAYLTNVLKVDANGDGNLSYGEIGAVRTVDVSQDVYSGIVDSLDGLGEFSYIESLSARKQPIKEVFAPDFYYLRELDVAHSGLEEFTPSYFNDIGTLQSIKVDHTNLYSLDLSDHNNLRTLSADQTKTSNDLFKVEMVNGKYQIDLANYIGNDIENITITPQAGMTVVDNTKLVFDDTEFATPKEVFYTANTHVNYNDAQANITGVNNNMTVSIIVYPPDVSQEVIENLNLRWYILNRQQVDKNKDGLLSYTERASLKEINVSRDVFPFWVTSLKGIEYFPNLESLTVRTQPIKEVDTSKNPKLKKLDIYRSAVGTLNISQNTALTDLNLYSNNLYTIDLSANTNLKTLTDIQYHYNKSDIPELVNGKYQFDLTKYVGEANRDKVSFTQTGLSYDKTTGIVTFDSTETAFAKEITYTYDDGLTGQSKTNLPDHKTEVMLYMYPAE